MAKVGPETAAAAAGLRYVHDGMSGIRRQPWGKGFTYYLPNGDRLPPSAERDRIESLAIPAQTGKMSGFAYTLTATYRPPDATPKAESSIAIIPTGKSFAICKSLIAWCHSASPCLNFADKHRLI